MLLVAGLALAVLGAYQYLRPSLPDVAAILELPLGTVKSRLAYGLETLRRHLGAEKRNPKKGT